MYTIRKTFKFEMCHQLFNAYSEDCCGQHGHSYICEIYLTSHKLDETGMVTDFKKIKDEIKDYIDSWDHCLVMPNTFPSEYLNMLSKYNKKMKVVDYNPTAENMACEMFKTIKKQIPELKKVRLHETTTGWAEYEESKTKPPIQTWE